MPIQVTCEGCGKQYAAKDEWAGKALRCKNCGSVVRVPQPEIDLAAVDLSALEAEPPATPLQPVGRPKPPAAQRNVLSMLSALGRWKIPVVAAALMLVFLTAGLLLKPLLGFALLIGLAGSAGYLLGGLGLWMYRVFQLAGGEGMVFDVLLWTRTGRRFIYSRWRHYGKAALMMLQGVLLFALTVLVVVVTVAVTPPRSARKKAPPPVATQQVSAEEIAQEIQRQKEEARAIEEQIKADFQRRREEREARFAEIRKRAQQSPEERKQPLVDKFGADRVVTIIVEQVSFRAYAAIVQRIRNLAGTSDLESHHGPGDRLWLATGPVTDLAALAGKIDFGEVTQVDEAQRTITVVADPSKLE